MTWIGNFAVIESPTGLNVGLVTGVQRSCATVSIATIDHPFLSDLQKMVLENGVPTQQFSPSLNKRQRDSDTVPKSTNRIIHAPVAKPFISTSVQCDVTAPIVNVKCVISCDDVSRGIFLPIAVGNLLAPSTIEGFGTRSQLAHILSAFFVHPTHSVVYPLNARQVTPLYRDGIKLMLLGMPSPGEHPCLLIQELIKALMVDSPTYDIVINYGEMKVRLNHCDSETVRPFVLITDHIPESRYGFQFANTQCVGIIVALCEDQEVDSHDVTGNCTVESPPQLPLGFLLKYSRVVNICINGARILPTDTVGLQLQASLGTRLHAPRVPMLIPLPSYKYKCAIPHTNEESDKTHSQLILEIDKVLDEMSTSKYSHSSSGTTENPAKIWAFTFLAPSFLLDAKAALTNHSAGLVHQPSLLIVVNKGTSTQWARVVKSVLQLEVYVSSNITEIWRWASSGGALVLEEGIRDEMLVRLAHGIIVAALLTEADLRLLTGGVCALLLISEEDRGKGTVTGTWRQVVETLPIQCSTTLALHNVSLTPPFPADAPSTSAPLWLQYSLISRSADGFGGYGQELCIRVKEVVSQMLLCCHEPRAIGGN